MAVTISASPPLSARGTTFSSKFWKGGIREIWRIMGGSGVCVCVCVCVCGGGGYYVFVERLLKTKYRFKRSISDVDLGLF